MIELLPSLIPLLLVDVINPVLLALMLVALGTDRPLSNSSALLAGHTVAYFIAGIVIALGLAQITDRLMNPHPIDYLFSATLGLLCLWAALKSRGGAASEEKTPDAELTPLYCFGFGAVINFIGVPFAVPYLAALNQILKADLPTESFLMTLGCYNLAYALPFALVPLLRVALGERCMPFLQRVNSVLVRTADTLMPIVLLLIGLALIADAALFYWSGKGLI
jgi:threonine/homoserine/homoserine lactone efflux protein